MSGESRQFRLSAVKTEDSAMAAMISSSCTPVGLQGSSRSIARFESENMRKRSMASGAYSACVELSDDNLCDEDAGSDDCAHFGDKKRRLTFEQVKTLEKSFEVGNKLEPERKMQLARALGLQPRQIAVWFQNRRARWKTKQLEKDFDALKQDYSALKTSYDALLQESKQYKEEVQRLKKEVLNIEDSKGKDRGGGGGGRSEMESQQTSTALFNPNSTSPIIKSEMKGRESDCPKDSEEAGKGGGKGGGGGGGGSSSIVSEATSVLIVDSPRTIDSPLSPAHQIGELRTPLAEQSEFYCPKMEEEEEERAFIHQEDDHCSLFYGYGLQEEHGPMLWEYWNHGL